VITLVISTHFIALMKTDRMERKNRRAGSTEAVYSRGKQQQEILLEFKGVIIIITYSHTFPSLLFCSVAIPDVPNIVMQ